MCGYCNNDKTRGKKQIKKKKKTQPLTTLADPRSYCFRRTASALSGSGFTPQPLKSSGAGRGGACGAGGGAGRRAAAAAAATTQTSGTVVVLSLCDRLSRFVQKKTWSWFAGSGQPHPPLFCFPKAAAGAGSDIPWLVGLRCPSVRRGCQNLGERISAPPHPTHCLRGPPGPHTPVWLPWLKMQRGT